MERTGPERPFKQGMRERGYVEGQHVVFERRVGEGRSERVPQAAAELVRMKVDLIVASTDQEIAAIKQQTQTIPIVMANSTDPVGTGFVASLAAPAGTSPATAPCPRSSARSDWSC